MFEFLKDMRKHGQINDDMLNLYLGVFITQEQYTELKIIPVTLQ